MNTESVPDSLNSGELIRSVPADTLSDRNWHLAEQERAALVNKIVDLGIMPRTVRLSTQATVIESILSVDEKLSAALRDERTPQEKGSSYYKALLRRQARQRKSA